MSKLDSFFDHFKERCYQYECDRDDYENLRENECHREYDNFCIDECDMIGDKIFVDGYICIPERRRHCSECCPECPKYVKKRFKGEIQIL
ncbi:hypothetical protein JYG23_07700 [Sedimentibacter sp. zth1]|uniref:hypothetical protein n=1 Tax=Sedimentibacter sp. zth1 TaxID=2816908 RepID=UPI001A915675|nr:hypothetical protein [Sedimentibacter sp. zth1]QSX07217.1 hypothetical protein JYG23_07700 [Sedimentibacter sp. zth1]